jgi:hypothetical protein
VSKYDSLDDVAMRLKEASQNESRLAEIDLGREFRRRVCCMEGKGNRLREWNEWEVQMLRRREKLGGVG